MTSKHRLHSSAGRATAALVATLLSLAAVRPALADVVRQDGDVSGILPVLPPGSPHDGASSKLSRDMDFVSMLGPKAGGW